MKRKEQKKEKGKELFMFCLGVAKDSKRSESVFVRTVPDAISSYYKKLLPAFSLHLHSYTHTHTQKTVSSSFFKKTKIKKNSLFFSRHKYQD